MDVPWLKMLNVDMRLSENMPTIKGVKSVRPFPRVRRWAVGYEGCAKESAFP